MFQGENMYICILLCWLVFCQFNPSQNYLRRRSLYWEMPPKDWCLGKSMGHFLDEWFVSEVLTLPLWIVSPMGKWSLSCKRKKAGQAMGSKPVSNTPPQLMLQVLLPGFLPCLSSFIYISTWWTGTGPCSPNQSSTIPFAFGHGLHHNNREQSKTTTKNEFGVWQFIA